MLALLRKLLPLDSRLRVAYHHLRGFLAYWIYGRPGRRMIVIGITGTKGKTTTTNLITHGLLDAGKRVFMFSTATICMDGVWSQNDTKMTSPSPFAIQRLLREAEHRGCEYAVIETSSHSIFYHRDYGIAYDTVVFTNLSQDHLDLHRTMDEYANTKKRLFDNLVYYPRKRGVKKIGIVNVDDAYAERFLSVTADTLMTFGIAGTAEVQARSIQETNAGMTVNVRIPSYEFTIRTKLRGRFNVYNLLAATAALIAQKIPYEKIAESLSKVEGIPGRLEAIANDAGVYCFVDYAHTESSLESVLSTLRGSADCQRIITVFGATGERDRDKRPKMAKVLDRLSDVVILTDDDTYGESSQRIIRDMLPGIPRKLGENFWIVPNREDAIRTALAIAERGDTVLLAGKGSETVQVTNKGPIPWSDADTARAVFRELAGNELELPARR